MDVHLVVMDNVAVFVCTCIAMHVTVLLTHYETLLKKNQNSCTIVKIQETTSKFRKLEKFKGLELCFCVVCNYWYSVTKTIKYLYTTQQLKTFEIWVGSLKNQKHAEF